MTNESSTDRRVPRRPDAGGTLRTPLRAGASAWARLTALLTLAVCCGSGRAFDDRQPEDAASARVREARLKEMKQRLQKVTVNFREGRKDVEQKLLEQP